VVSVLYYKICLDKTCGIVWGKPGKTKQKQTSLREVLYRFEVGSAVVGGIRPLIVRQHLLITTARRGGVD